MVNETNTSRKLKLYNSNRLVKRLKKVSEQKFP